MLYRTALAYAFLATAASCGDNRGAGPDAQPPDGGGQTCGSEVEANALASGSWDRRFTIPGFTGHDGSAPAVYDFARDVDGSLIAAGKFEYVGSTSVEPLMRWRNGAWEPARTSWELAPPGSGFSAISIASDGTLALATYDDFGDRAVEVWIDDGSGLRSIGAFEGMIRSLRWYDDQLWVAGWFQIASGGSTIQGLAVWDGATWQPPPGGAPDGFAFELIEDGGDLLVGGVFAEIGGIAANSVAAWNGATWRALSFPEPLGVYALSRDAQGELYAGGSFGYVEDGVGGLMRWTGTTWELVGNGIGNRFLAGVVTDLTEHDGSLYVTGCFHTVNGGQDAPGAITALHVARWDGAWHSLDDGGNGGVRSSWVEPQQCGDEGPNSVWGVSMQRVFGDGDRVLVGGSFPGIGGTISQSLIAHDGARWVAQADGGGLGLGGNLERIAASSSCDVWGYGELSHVGGRPASTRVVHFTGDGWEAIEDDIPSDAYCPGFAVSPGGEVSVGLHGVPARRRRDRPDLSGRRPAPGPGRR